MPKIWEEMVNAIKRNNKKEGISNEKRNPYAIATSVLQKRGVLKKGTRELVKKKK